MISSITEIAELSLLSDALDAPFLNPYDYPKEEEEAVFRLSSNLNGYIQMLKGFEYALDLSVRSLNWRREATATDRAALAAGDHSKTEYLQATRNRLQGWVRMAANQGAMLSYSCAQVMESDAKQLLPKCPTLAAKVEMHLVEASRSLLEDTFPSVRMIRLAAAHPYELGATIKGFERHATKGDIWDKNIQTTDSSGIMVDGSITVSGNAVTYEATIKGRHVGYTLSQETMEKLAETVRMYLAAFDPARHVPPAGGYHF